MDWEGGKLDKAKRNSQSRDADVGTETLERMNVLEYSSACYAAKPGTPEWAQSILKDHLLRNRKLPNSRARRYLLPNQNPEVLEPFPPRRPITPLSGCEWWSTRGGPPAIYRPTGARAGASLWNPDSGVGCPLLKAPGERRGRARAGGHSWRLPTTWV